MGKKRGQNLLQGASILAASTIFVKLIGAVFRIPLGNILNGEAMGYYSTSYSIFSAIYAFATAGLPAAIAKMVAEQSVRGRYRDIQKLHKLSVKLFLLLGIFGFLIMALFSGVFVQMASNPNAWLSVVAISPAIFFCCITSAYRGYYEGFRNMIPTAVSQAAEVVAKLIFGLGCSSAVLYFGNRQFSDTGIVFGKAAATADEAAGIIAPYASAAAIFGITLSTAVGTLYLLIRDRREKGTITQDDLKYSPKAMRAKTLMVRLLKIAIPISLGSIVVNVAQLIDTVTIIGRLDYAFSKFPEAMNALFSPYISAEVFENEGAANFIYGSYSGYALSIFNLVPAFTGIFGKSALPNITAAWEAKNRKLVRINGESVIRMTSLIAIPASFGIFFLAGPILTLLFPGKVSEVAVASSVLSWQGISLIFLGLTTPLFAVLQGLGRVDLPPKFMLAGVIAKFAANFFLIGIPAINVNGAAAGTFSCYFIIVILCFIYLRKITGLPFSFVRLTIKPLIAGLLCGLSAKGVYLLLDPLVQSHLKTLVAVAAGGMVYVIFILLLRALSRDDLRMLPRGEKFIKVLEKYKLIG